MSESCLKESQEIINQSDPSFLNLKNSHISPVTPENNKALLGNFHKQAVTFHLSFVFLGFLLGYVFGWQNEPHSWQSALGWGFSGGILGLGIIAIERVTQHYPASDIFQIAQSVAIGILMACMVSWLMEIIFPTTSYLVSFLSLTSLLAFPYLTLTIRNRELEDTRRLNTEPWPFGIEQSQNFPPKILDTSTIIDGRILDLYETGFLEGPVCIPRFVLRELHYIADSSQPWKRARGKRGLEILSRFQEIPGINIQITEKDFSHIPEVDHKLIKLAQLVQGKIATNDWNLAKIASVEKVQTLNVNRLFHQLKPPVLPGEVIRVLINKEGDLAGQGVAHLDDGTMIVVDQACDYVQETVDVVITKFMQTQSGRILFGSRL